MTRTRTRIVAAIAIAVALVAVAVTAVNGYRYFEQRADERTRADAVSTAERTVTAMFSYDHTTVDTELPRAADQLTGDFRADYLRLIREAIVPGAKEKKLTVRATVEAGGIVSDENSHAVVLLFLNQVTTSGDNAQGATTGSRVRVGLDRNDDRWLVSGVTPI
ncbi:h domain protein [Nocardia bovistercoris]|uniref:H domain protein n=1 Tax=Nocardia bovistercoris TaxID=2785916 RepID=A0A931IB56_9NOCA|nr:h domain protein [Nocardia bovistercoris]MBH0776635.1 h domain protein [Nocardia bovistercoris]